MKTVKTLTVILGLTLTSSMAFAFDCKEASKKAPKGTSWKECKKSTRKGSDIKEFLLTKDGDLFAYMPKTNQDLCQITANVVDFKASAHPNDAATAYYISNGDLSYVRTEKAVKGGNCPKANKALLMRNVKKIEGKYQYSVVSNTNTTIVNVALDTSNVLRAWANTGAPVYTDNNVVDYSMNQCFGSEGKSFSSYVMFTIDGRNRVTKVKGLGNGVYIKDTAKEDPSYYSDLTQFTKKGDRSNPKSPRAICQ